MLETNLKRQYVLLRPCAKGGGGYARLEQARGKYVLTINAHGFAPSEEGVRVLLAAGDEGGGAAVYDLGLLPISVKGQCSLKREIAVLPGGLSLDAYSALCVAKDWPSPKLLMLGTLKQNSPLSAYLMGETVCRYLSVPARMAVISEAREDAIIQESVKSGNTDSVPTAAPAAAVPFAEVSDSPSPPPSKASGPSAQAPAEASDSPAVLPILPLVLPAAAVSLAKPPEKAPLPFSLVQASPPARPASPPPAAPTVAPPHTDDFLEDLDPAVLTAAMERAEFPPDVPPAGPPPGRLPVTALPTLFWPTAVKELERYFFTYPPFAPFDAPGWRFVQVPMASGSRIPYYAVGMLARDGKVAQVAYAVPGERGTLPPAGFSGYRWQQGRNGQGYWTLWKKA